MIRQLIPEEFCLKCRGCCRFAQTDSVWSPNLSEEDVEGLLKIRVPPFFMLDNKKIRLLYNREQDNFICSLLDQENNKCRVYAFRPLECRLYPFLLNRRKGKVFLALDLRCPFARKEQKTKVFKEYLRYLTGFLNSPGQLKVLKNSPQLIQNYDQATDLAEINI